MRCPGKTRAIVELELGLLSPEAAEALERHLAGCSRCATAARTEQTLTGDLQRLRGEYSGTLEVRERVLVQLPRLAAGDRLEVPRRHLWWAAAAAALFGLVLFAGSGLLAPQVTEMAHTAVAVGSSLSEIGRTLAATATTLALLPVRFLGSFLVWSFDLADRARQLQPIGIAFLGLSYLAMLSFILYILRRDFKQRVAHD